MLHRLNTIVRELANLFRHAFRGRVIWLAITISALVVTLIIAISVVRESRLSPEQQAYVETLLTLANKQVTASNIVEPESDNAYQTYRRILSIDPDNEEALEGLKRIADLLAKRARAKRAEGELEDSLTIVDQALKKFPEHSRLLALKKELEERQKQAELSRKIMDLLAKAEQQLSHSRFTSPPGDNALETYQTILSMDPGNQAAKVGLERIAEHFLAQARQELNAGDREAALSAIREGLKIDPEHSKLQSLRAEVQISELLEQAEQQLEASKLTTPAGDNAYETYRQVLALDADNAQARQGLRNIADRYEELAQGWFKAKEYPQALAFAERGLEVMPEHKALTALRQDIEQALTAEEKAREKERQIGELLQQAERQLAASKLTTPGGDNAYETYQQVLELEADNRQAQQGLKQIAGRYAEQAQDRLEAKEYQQALALAERGLEVMPDHKALTALRQDIEQALTAEEKARERERRIGELLQQAERQLAASKLTTPAGDNAYESYQQVLELDTDNRQAEQGLKQIAGRYAEQAQDRLEAKDYQQALALAERGLEVMPDHKALTALRQDIEQALTAEEKARERERRIGELLQQAERQLAASKLTTPAGDNAYETYRQVLALDADNAQARQGLKQIAGRYEGLARRLFEARRYEQALGIAEQGLEVMPDHKALQTLHQQIERAMKEPPPVVAEEKPEEKPPEKERQIAELLQRAEQQLAEFKLTTPPGDNAYETYRQVLALEADNAQARQGLKNIADRYAQLAKRRFNDGDYKRALRYTERGLEIVADHEMLEALRRDIKQAMAVKEKAPEIKKPPAEKEKAEAEAQEKQKQIVELLRRADRQLAASKLTTPAGDNAYETYQQVLALEADNGRARQGIRKIADRYAQLAKSQFEAGDYPQALESVSRGLEVVPDHGALKTLHQEIRQAMRAPEPEPETEERWRPFGTF